MVASYIHPDPRHTNGHKPSQLSFTDRLEAATVFTDMLYGGSDTGCAILWVKGQPTRHYDMQDQNAITRMAYDAVTISDTDTVYVGVNLLGAPPAGAHDRGKSEDVTVVTGAYVDLDVRPGDSTKPQTQRQIADLLDTLPLVPSLIVSSGRGLHVYWLFKEPFVIEAGTDDRAVVSQILKGWERSVHQVADDRHGWTFDHVADLARVLRVAGTINHPAPGKVGGPFPVEIIHQDPARYTLGDLEQYIPDDTPGPHDYQCPEEGAAALTSAQIDAIAAAVVPSWVDGQRHHMARGLSGWLASSRGIGESSTLRCVDRCSALAGDRDTPSRLKTAQNAYARMRSGQAVAGFSLLKQLMPVDDVRQLERAVPRITITYAEPPRGNDVPPEEPQTAQDVRRFNLTDMGNGERLRHQHGDDIRYCRQLGRWLIWEDGRFAEDLTGEIIERAKKVTRSIYAEAADEPNDKERAVIVKHARSSEQMSRLKAMIESAETEDGIRIRQDQLDRDPWLLTVTNGTIDLRTGQLRPHSRADLITMLAPVAYDPAAECPRFLAFLRRAMGDNEELITFLQRLTGYSLTGLTVERIIAILFGPGKNGKSTYLEVIRSILGDYALRTPTETLLAKRESGIPNDVARLRGKRFVTASESEDGQRLAEAKIKDLTGGDMISARFMRAEFFDFMPTFKIILSTNHKPVIRGTDPAIWDRIRLVPFEVSIPPAEQDKHLREKLTAEGSGILKWAVQGCLDWQAHGLGNPAKVRTATDAYKSEMDVLGGFFEESCTLDPSESVSKSDLYSVYSRWCEASGERAVTKTAFGKRMLERGFDEARGSAPDRTRIWIGIGLQRPGGEA